MTARVTCPVAEDPLLRDDPPNPDFDEETLPPEQFKRIFTDARPETMGYIEEMRAVVDEFPDRVLLGEVQGGAGRVGPFYGAERPRFHLPLNFLLLDTKWEDSTNAGFTTGRPWLPIRNCVAARNVATQSADERSMLSLYRRLISLRQSEPLLLWVVMSRCVARAMFCCSSAGCTVRLCWSRLISAKGNNTSHLMGVEPCGFPRTLSAATKP